MREKVVRQARVFMVLACAALMAACSPEFNWREVQVDDAVGLVMFPDKPDSQSRSLDFSGHVVQFTMTSAKAGDTVFVVGHALWPESLQGKPGLREQMGRQVIASLYENLGSEVPAELPAFGDRFEVETSSGGLLRAQVWLGETGLVEGMVMGPAAQYPNERPGSSWIRLQRDVNLRGREQAALVSNTDGGHATLGFELVAGILNMEVNGTLGYAKNHSDFPTCFSH